MTFLVDTNVLSEPTRPAPNDRAMVWLRSNETELATSTIVLDEIEDLGTGYDCLRQAESF